MTILTGEEGHEIPPDAWNRAGSLGNIIPSLGSIVFKLISSSDVRNSTYLKIAASAPQTSVSRWTAEIGIRIAVPL